MTTLTRQLRDNAGHLHAPGETIEIIGKWMPRSTFDPRLMAKARMANGNVANVFQEDIQVDA